MCNKLPVIYKNLFIIFIILAFSACSSSASSIPTNSFDRSSASSVEMPPLENAEELGFGYTLYKIENAPPKELSAYLEEDYFRYEDLAYITGYWGDNPEVIIPTEIDGYSVAGLEEEAFSGNELITSVFIPDNIRDLPKSCFANCTSLTNITIPNGLNSISEYCFSNCTSLAEISLPASLQCIENLAFNGCTSLKKVTIPDSVNFLGAGAFKECTSLEQVILGTGLKTLEDSTFSYCFSLSTIRIPGTIEKVGHKVFAYCSSLNEVIFEEGLSELCTDAFLYCGTLSNSGEVYYKGERIGSSLKALNLPSSLRVTDSVDGFGGIPTISYNGETFSGMDEDSLVSLYIAINGEDNEVAYMRKMEEEWQQEAEIQEAQEEAELEEARQNAQREREEILARNR